MKRNFCFGQKTFVSLELEKEVSPYGKEVSPEEAPEAISQAVASLPPEQMFELMKQMKVWNEHNLYFRNLCGFHFFLVLWNRGVFEKNLKGFCYFLAFIRKTVMN